MAEEQENIKLQFDSNAKTVAGDINKLGASIESTTQSTNENNQAVEQGNQSYKTFKTQLREANQELQKSIQLYGETSAETVKAAKAVADLKDQMGFAKDLSDSFNPDQKMKALGAATQVAGTGLQGVTAGMALFGGESEDTQKQLLKVQAAMAFSDAISNLSNLGDQWQLLKATIQSSSLATKANTAATGAAAIIQNVFTGSVATTSAGFKALKFAIAATGIGLLVVGVGLLVANFDKVKKVVLNLVPGLASVGDMVMSIVNAVTDFIGVTSEADRALDRLKANADASIALNKKFLAEHGSQLDEFTKQKIEAKNKYNEAIKEDGADQVALAKELNRELAKIEYSRGDEQRKIQEENAEKAKEEEEKRRQKAKEDAEKKKQEDLKFQQDIQDEIGKMNVRKVEQEIQDRLDEQERLRLQQEETTANIDRLEEENQKKADKEIEIDKAVVDAKKANQDLLVSQGESLIANVKNLAGKNKAIQKAAIIAEGGVSVGKSIANTAEAVTKDLAKGAPFSAPLVALDLAVGATSVASIVSGTAKALQAIGSGGSISAGQGVGGITKASAPPTVAFNNTAENQIGQSVAKTQAEQPPLQVIVAESDITNAQNNVKVLENKNKF